MVGNQVPEKRSGMIGFALLVIDELPGLFLPDKTGYQLQLLPGNFPPLLPVHLTLNNNCPRLYLPVGKSATYSSDFRYSFSAFWKALYWISLNLLLLKVIKPVGSFHTNRFYRIIKQGRKVAEQAWPNQLPYNFRQQHDATKDQDHLMPCGLLPVPLHFGMPTNNQWLLP